MPLKGYRLKVLKKTVKCQCISFLSLSAVLLYLEKKLNWTGFHRVSAHHITNSLSRTATHLLHLLYNRYPFSSKKPYLSLAHESPCKQRAWHQKPPQTSLVSVEFGTRGQAPEGWNVKASCPSAGCSPPLPGLWRTPTPSSKPAWVSIKQSNKWTASHHVHCGSGCCYNSRAESGSSYMHLISLGFAILLFCHVYVDIWNYMEVQSALLDSTMTSRIFYLNQTWLKYFVNSKCSEGQISLIRIVVFLYCALLDISSVIRKTICIRLCKTIVQADLPQYRPNGFIWPLYAGRVSRNADDGRTALQQHLHCMIPIRGLCLYDERLLVLPFGHMTLPEVMNKYC